MSSPVTSGRVNYDRLVLFDAGFHRSSHGNLCCQIGPRHLAVFKYRMGRFRYSIRDTRYGDVKFSSSTYASEEDALMALFRELTGE